MWSDLKMNINVVEPHVLSLFRNLNKNVVEEIIKLRAKKEITSMNDLKEIPSFPERMIPILDMFFGCTSSYFNLKIELINEDWSSTRYFDIVFEKKTGRILKWEEM